MPIPDAAPYHVAGAELTEAQRFVEQSGVNDKVNFLSIRVDHRMVYPCRHDALKGGTTPDSMSDSLCESPSTPFAGSVIRQNVFAYSNKLKVDGSLGSVR